LLARASGRVKRPPASHGVPSWIVAMPCPSPITAPLADDRSTGNVSAGSTNPSAFRSSS
jgi:hypothetical protein